MQVHCHVAKVLHAGQKYQLKALGNITKFRTQQSCVPYCFFRSDESSLVLKCNRGGCSYEVHYSISYYINSISGYVRIFRSNRSSCRAAVVE